jgi:DNA-binding MarR family transcriptional regulator
MNYYKLFSVLTPEQFKIYVYFCETYGFFWKELSQTTIGSDLSMSRSTVNAGIKSLVYMELIEKDPTTNGKENRYRVLPVTKEVYGEFFVYVLYKQGHVVYVGSTQNIVNRVSSHKLDKDFDHVRYCTLPDKKSMLKVEKYGISKLKPTLNSKIPNPTDRFDIKLVWKDY